MVTVTVQSGGGVDLSWATLYDQLANSTIQQTGSTATQYTAVDDGHFNGNSAAIKFVVTGTGFMYTGMAPNIHLAGGTITGMQEQDSSNHVLATFTNLSIPATTFNAALNTYVAGGAHPNPTGLNDIFLPQTYASTGGAGSDKLPGGNAADTIIGGQGADTMSGGLGDDVYFVDNVGDSVLESPSAGNDIVHTSIDYTLGANVESLILDGTTINGSGNADNNAIIGNASNNIIDGRAGADLMQGGAGNDIYFVDSAGDSIVENVNEGNDIVHATIDYTIGANIESLILDGLTINGAGNATGNAIVGNDADNIIDGRGGGDLMQGGKGNDIYVVDNAADSVVENLNEGNDIVHASIDYTIGANIESLILDGTTINGGGNSTGNAIIGNDSNNIIDGKAGADLMQGGKGDDIYFVDNAGDSVIENLNEGNDIVHATIDYTIGASIESLILDGTANLAGAGNSDGNAIVGSSGNNILDGRGGQDFLTGNGGNDTFAFKSGEASGDLVADFTGNGAAAGDSFLFIGFGSVAQGATFTQVGATNQWQIHSGLDGHNEVITLQNSATVHASDFQFAADNSPKIVITEIMADPTKVPDSDGEWFEITNTGTADVDLNGWSFKVNSQTTVITQVDPLIIHAGQIFIVARSLDPVSNGDLPTPQITGVFTITNTATITLSDKNNNIIDVVDTTNFTHQAGKALNLDPDTYDAVSNDNAINWAPATAQYGLGDFGTPGLQNSQVMGAQHFDILS